MTLSLLRLNPAKPSYQITDTGSTKRQSFDSAKSRFATGILHAPWMLNTVWVTDIAGFTYFRAWWRSTIFYGSSPFMARVVFPLPTLTKHKAFIVPGTLQHSEIDGEKFTIAATLEVSSVIIP